MKKFSIITINLNNREGLKKTIESIVNQTCNDFEYIVIDGGSTDGSVDIIKAYSAKIDYWVSEPDKGIFNAMNKGILKATSEYCIFMNSGDCFHQKDVLEKVSPECHEDIVLGKVIKGVNPYPEGYPFQTISMMQFFKSTIFHQATFIRKTLFKNNLYEEKLRIVSDWKFFIDTLIYKNCSFKNIDIVIADFDDNGVSYTLTNLNKSEREKVLKEYLPERIYSDYNKFIDSFYSPLLDFAPLLNKTYKFQKLVCTVISIMITIYNTYHTLTNILKNNNKSCNHF